MNILRRHSRDREPQNGDVTPMGWCGRPSFGDGSYKSRTRLSSKRSQGFGFGNNNNDGSSDDVSNPPDDSLTGTYENRWTDRSAEASVGGLLNSVCEGGGLLYRFRSLLGPQHRKAPSLTAFRNHS
jgi:hypothetical protein